MTHIMEPIKDIIIRTIIAHFIRYFSSFMLNLTKNATHNDLGRRATMANYKRVLVAVDLTDDSDQVLQRAVDIAERNGAALHIIHVIEIISFAYGGDVPMDLTSLQEQIDKHANERMKAKAEALNYPVEKTLVATGNTEEEIHQHAAKIS